MTKKNRNDLQIPRRNPSKCFAGQPVTRRSLLAQGVFGFSGYVVTPSLLSMLSNRMYAQEMAIECPSMGSAAAAGVSYFQIEAEGGAVLASDVVPGQHQFGQAFAPLSESGYKSMGLGGGAISNQMNMTKYGAPVLIGPGGALIRGLESVVTDPNMQARIRIALGAGISADDGAGVRSNQHNPSIFAAQMSGVSARITSVIGNGRGNATSRSFFDNDMGISDPSIGVTSELVENLGQAQALVDPGAIAARLSNDAALAILSAADRMSASALRRFSAKSLSDQIKEAVHCNYKGSLALAQSATPAALDPQADLTTLNINGLRDADRAVALKVKMLTDGNAAAATHVVGGCDYHGRGLQTQMNKNEEIGRAIGMAIRFADLKGQKIFIGVVSNGACSANQNGNEDTATGRLAFGNDLGNNGAYLMIAYDPNAAPAMNHSQVGSFNAGGGVNPADLVTAGNTQYQALNIMLNYAAFSGKMDDFHKILKAAGQESPFGRSDQDRQPYLAFKDINT